MKTRFCSIAIVVRIKRGCGGRHQFLLGLKHKKGLPKGKGVFSFPGGHQEKGETPLECARRELQEETCIVASGGKHIGIISFFAGKSTRRPAVIAQIFLFTSFVGNAQATGEYQAVGWYWGTNMPWEDMNPSDCFWAPLCFTHRDKKMRFDVRYSRDTKKFLSLSVTPKKKRVKRK